MIVTKNPMKPQRSNAAAIRLGEKASYSPSRNGVAGPPMEPWRAVDSLMALAHETRLAIFRLLVQAGPDGLSAGAISVQLDVTPSTLSHHLAVLERAGILDSRRHRRQIFYGCSYDGMRELLEFLTNDCCQGHPDLCGFVAGGSKNGKGTGTKSGCRSDKKR